jgi:hypothetical protein
MESGFRSPLLDLFKRGDVPVDVRLAAAQGALSPRAQEQLALLMLLSADPDAGVARAAEQTLQAIPRDVLSSFLARGDVAAEIRTFMAARGVEPAGPAAPDGDAPLIEPSPQPDEPSAQPDEPSAPEQSLLQRIAAMNVAQRIARAMRGSREERAILIRDPNKIVAVAVLSSPKVSETEVESFARMTTVSEEILRIIGATRGWIKNYGVVLALTRNPKTPVAMSMNLLSRLNDRDLRQLSTDRNIPDVLRLTARKKLVLEK